LIVGIDLGTTFSAIARLDDLGKPEIISVNGQDTTPSVVFFDEAQNRILVGQEAVELGFFNPKGVEEFIKRRIGDQNDQYVRQFRNQQYRPEDISAEILKGLKIAAEFEVNEPVEQVVITVPANMTACGKERTRKAGEKAGFNSIMLVSEPTAAALDYTARRKPVAQNVAVYDLGGGTFDATILRMEPGTSGGWRVRVLATDGDNRLGGKDFDEAIIGYIAQQLASQHQVDRRSFGPQEFFELRRRAEQAKVELSGHNRHETTLRLNLLGRSYQINLNRDTFNSLIEGALIRAETKMDQAIGKAQLSTSQIDLVLLVGGSSRIPLVRERLCGKFGKEKVNSALNPDKAVAHGAALMAGKIKVEEESKQDSQGRQGRLGGVSEAVRNELGGLEVSDILPYSIGVVASRPNGPDFNSIILSRGTPLPMQNWSSRQYHTNTPGGAVISLVQGDTPELSQCITIGELQFDLPNLPAQTEVNVFIRCRADGLLEAVAEAPKYERSVQGEIRLRV